MSMRRRGEASWEEVIGRHLGVCVCVCVCVLRLLD